MKKTKIKTKEQAIAKAIEFQNWQSNRPLSYQELFDWADYFEQLGIEFDLTDEFNENGLI